jgi:hypothetical protein
VCYHAASQGMPCRNGEPQEFELQDAAARWTKAAFPRARVLQYRITDAVPYAAVVHRKMLSDPDYFVRWHHSNGSFVGNGSICQNWDSGCFNNGSRINDPQHDCPFEIRASAYNWIRGVDVDYTRNPMPQPAPGVLRWFIDNVIARTLEVGDGAWIDGDGPDNGAWMCSGGTGPRHKTTGDCPPTGCALNYTENIAFQNAEAVVIQRAHEYLISRGGFDYRCLRFVGPLHVPQPTDSEGSCNAKLHALAFDPNVTSTNGTVLYGERVRGIGYSDDTVQEAVAVFFLVRQEHFYLGSLARSNMSSVMVENLFHRDYGAPLEAMRQRASDGVWERQYEGATVRFSCSNFSSSFAPKAHWRQ